MVGGRVAFAGGEMEVDPGHEIPGGRQGPDPEQPDHTGIGRRGGNCVG